MIDYRDTYTGYYFCSRICGKLNSELKTHVYTTDTITISIIKDEADSILQINLGNQVVKVKLLEYKMRAFPSSGYFGGKFFATDSIDFGIALGMSKNCRYIGKKQE
jgi:hypothetical protein